MTSRLSSLEASRNPQVLMTMASAPSWSETSFMPPVARTPSIFSLSTRFFGQPRLTKATERISSEWGMGVRF
jgi:hypothetical protein